MLNRNEIKMMIWNNLRLMDLQIPCALLQWLWWEWCRDYGLHDLPFPWHALEYEDYRDPVLDRWE
jgi:hypothetical protein